MEDNNNSEINNFLSRLFKPAAGESKEITYDAQGWVEVDEVLHKGKAEGVDIDFLSLVNFVENETQLYKFNEDMSKIRLN